MMDWPALLCIAKKVDMVAIVRDAVVIPRSIYSQEQITPPTLGLIYVSIPNDRR